MEIKESMDILFVKSIFQKFFSPLGENQEIQRIVDYMVKYLNVQTHPWA